MTELEEILREVAAAAVAAYKVEAGRQSRERWKGYDAQREADDPSYREHRLQRARDSLREFRERNPEYSRNYYAQNRERILARRRERLATDPAFRERERERDRLRDAQKLERRRERRAERASS